MRSSASLERLEARGERKSQVARRAERGARARAPRRSLRAAARRARCRSRRACFASRPRRSGTDRTCRCAGTQSNPGNSFEPASTKSCRRRNSAHMSRTHAWSPVSAARAAACEIVHAFVVLWLWMARHRLDHGDGPGRVADAPAAHRVRLRHAVDRDRAVVELGARLREARERLVGPIDVLVDVVRQDRDVRVRAQHLAERRPVGARVHRAGRIARAVQDQRAACAA